MPQFTSCDTCISYMYRQAKVVYVLYVSTRREQNFSTISSSNIPGYTVRSYTCGCCKKARSSKGTVQALGDDVIVLDLPGAEECL